MSQTERIAYLDRRLRERGWVTAAEVATAFEVSPRQVKRDIEYLRWRLDAPIAYDAASHRYRYERPYDRFQFADERRVLFSALVKGWSAAAAAQNLVTPQILAEVDAAVPRDYRAVADRIRFVAPSVEAVDLEVFSGLCRGLRDGKIVELSYISLAGESSRRRVEAERLLNYAGTWYLVAFDHSRRALRTFHLGRIVSLTVTADPVTQTDPEWRAQVDSWTTSGFGIFQGGPTFPATVRFRGAAERLVAAQVWHPAQLDSPGADEQGTWLERTVPVVDHRELLGRVLSYGADAQAMAPEEFRRLWQDEIRRMANQTSAPPTLATMDTIRLLARYNETVNAAMNKTIAQLSGQEWTRDLGGFHSSVKALCAHLYVCDLNWMKRFGGIRPFRVLERPEFGPDHPWSAVLVEGVDDYLKKRLALDGVLSKFAEEITEKDLGSRLSYTDWRGMPQDRDVAGLLLHLFHHQTHHRGMISIDLEILGHANEFSSLVPLV